MELFSIFAGIPQMEQISPNISATTGLPELERPEEIPISVLRLIVQEDENKPRKQSRKIESYEKIIKIAEDKGLPEDTLVKDALK